MKLCAVAHLFALFSLLADRSNLFKKWQLCYIRMRVMYFPFFIKKSSQSWYGKVHQIELWKNDCQNSLSFRNKKKTLKYSRLILERSVLRSLAQAVLFVYISILPMFYSSFNLIAIYTESPFVLCFFLKTKHCNDVVYWKNWSTEF